MESPAPNTEGKSLIILFPQASQGNAYLLEKVKTLYQGDPAVHVVDANTGKEVAGHVQQHNSGLVIFSIRNKEDLGLVLNGLVEWNSYIRGKFLRVVGVCELPHPQIPGTLMKRGCADLFALNLNDKALKHKINQSLKILVTYQSQLSAAKQQTLAAADASAKAASTATQVNASPIKRLQALTLASDCWLLRKDKDLRQVQGRWIIDFIGPGPSAGIWDASEKEASVWDWKPKATAEAKDFITDEGNWSFRGRKPEFVWDIGRWRFLGDAPELFFKKGEEKIAIRFKVVGRDLELAENSTQARAKLPLIIKSVENEVHFRNDEKAKVGPGKEVVTKSARPGSILDYEDDSDESGIEPNVHDLTPEKAPEHSGGFAQNGEAEVIPFNQAPKPKLKITVQSAQTGAGKPVEANPIELSDTDLILEVPTGLLSVEQAVLLVIDDGLMTPQSTQRVNATVKQILGTEADSDQVAIHIDPAVKLSLDTVKDALKARQEEILDFLKAARGW